MADSTNTTNPSVLLALADRCEREEPSRELDSEVLVACGHQALNRGPRIGWEWRRDGKGIWSRMPSPTTSLDAAVGLVPKREIWSVHGCDAPGHKAFADVSTIREPHYFTADAATPALALCAAALRARAALANGDA